MPEFWVGMFVLVLLLGIPLVALRFLFWRLRLLAQWRDLYTAWAPALASGVGKSSWRLLPGDLRTTLPTLEGDVGGRQVQFLPMRHRGDVVDVRVRLPLAFTVRHAVAMETPAVRHAISQFFRPQKPLGDEEFDSELQVTSTADEESLRRLIQPEARENLLDFIAERQGRVIVHAHGDRLDAVELGGPLCADGLPALVDALCSLAHALEQREPSPDDGLFCIEFSGAPTPDSEIVCQVCGSPLKDKGIECVACATPHHCDCWEYYGGCATYACQCRQGRPYG